MTENCTKQAGKLKKIEFTVLCPSFDLAILAIMRALCSYGRRGTGFPSSSRSSCAEKFDSDNTWSFLVAVTPNP